MSSFNVGLANPFMKISPFLFKTIQHPAGQGNAFSGDFQRQIEEQRQVGLNVLMYPVLKRENLAAVQPSPTALVSVGGIAETVADDPFAFGQCGFDHPGQMLAAGSKHQQGFGFKVHGVIKQ